MQTFIGNNRQLGFILFSLVHLKQGCNAAVSAVPPRHISAMCSNTSTANHMTEESHKTSTAVLTT